MEFLYDIPLLILSIIIFILIFVFYIVGVKTGNWQKRKNPDAVQQGIGPLETALLGLLSLLLSFTFSQAASRYDNRRADIVTEANNIGTAILRADLYHDQARTMLRKYLQDYVEARIEYYTNSGDELKVEAALKNAEIISGKIWKLATELSNDSTDLIRDYHMLPALNGIDDARTKRDATMHARVPDSIIFLLIILILLGSFIIGYARKQRKNDWIILTIYALMTVITMYTIMDLDRPRRGLIRTDKTHEKIIQLREYFKQ